MNITTYSPDSEQVDEEVSREFSSQHLGNDVQVGNKCGLKDDGDV